MTTDQPTYNFNTDGSIDIPVSGQPVRFVKESDLLAVKGGSETKAREWETEKVSFNTQLAEANRLREESHSLLLQERAAKEQLEKTQPDYDTVKTKVGELETEIGSHKESIGKHEKEIAGRIHQSLIASGASEESLKDKDLSQLRNLEEAAKVFGGNKVVKPANYDGGPGGPGGGSVPETPLDRANRILEEHDAKKGKVRV